MSAAIVRAPIAIAALLCAFAPSIAHAKDAGAVTVDFLGGGFIRSDKGFYEHARAFGYPISGGGGGSLEVGVELLPRLSIYGSWSGYSNTAERRLASITLTTQAFLLHARFAFARHEWKHRWGDVLLQGEASIGGGAYAIKSTFEDPSLYSASFDHVRRTAGARFGVDASVYWRSLGFLVGYAFHFAPAAIEDNLGGKVYAGGHEIRAGLSLRF